jgi:hypothetical protein
VLDAKQVTIKTTVDARKQRIDAEAAWELLQSAASITTARGKKVQAFNPTLDNKADILKHAMGPSGNLRAPALHVKDQFIIGFNLDFYEQVF